MKVCYSILTPIVSLIISVVLRNRQWRVLGHCTLLQTFRDIKAFVGTNA